MANELSTEEFKLYELIWRRTIASQMTDAVGSSVSVRIRAVSTAGEEADFGATGKTITDPGFLQAYVESSDDEDAEAEDAERRLPNLVKDQPLTADALEALGPHAPSRRPATPRRRWSRRWRSWASAARRRTRRSCRRSRTAGTCSSAARR